MTYRDFPACLDRYAWLLGKGEHAFDANGRCKACGDPVHRHDFADHLARHRTELVTVRRAAKAQQQEIAA